MSDSYRIPGDQQRSGASPGGNGYQSVFGTPSQGSNDSSENDAGEVGKTLLVGLLGGLVAAAGYMVYRRLPDEQKERLHTQVRTVVQQRISEIRENFNI